jgi:hypothetical protein
LIEETLALSLLREYEHLEELDFELLRGFSFSFLALLLKKLKVLSIGSY